MPELPSTPRASMSSAPSRFGSFSTCLAGMTACVCQPVVALTSSPTWKADEVLATTTPRPAARIVSPICTGGR
jgi:hypothetical protein